MQADCDHHCQYLYNKGGTSIISNSVEDDRFLQKKKNARLNGLVVFIIIFDVQMKTRISSAYATRM